MRGSVAKRLRREARQSFPNALGAEDVSYSGLKQLVNVATDSMGSVFSKIVGGNRHLGKMNIKRIYRSVKKLSGQK